MCISHRTIYGIIFRDVFCFTNLPKYVYFPSHYLSYAIWRCVPFYRSPEVCVFSIALFIVCYLEMCSVLQISRSMCIFHRTMYRIIFGDVFRFTDLPKYVYFPSHYVSYAIWRCVPFYRSPEVCVFSIALFIVCYLEMCSVLQISRSMCIFHRTMYRMLFGDVFRFTDLPKSLYRVLKCPVYTLALCGVICVIFMVAGSMSFGPKYIEHQFTVPGYKANIIVGESLVCIIPTQLNRTPMYIMIG